jgi:hypothetical protein
MRKKAAKPTRHVTSNAPKITPTSALREILIRTGGEASKAECWAELRQRGIRLPADTQYYAVRKKVRTKLGSIQDGQADDRLTHLPLDMQILVLQNENRQLRLVNASLVESNMALLKFCM